MNSKIEMIKAFSDANGVSGFEDEVVELLKKYVPTSYQVKEDHLRNAYISKEIDTQKPTILLDAHSDEVGLIVQAIKPNGTITFLTIGGWVASSLPSSKVRILNEKGEYVSGVIASKPPHFMSANDKKELSIEDMVIDIGATCKQEVEEKFHVSIGAPVVCDVKCTYDAQKDIFMGKAFDCRIGCCALIATLERLENATLATNVMATLSSQEEVGERGMALITKHVHPDVAIVFEGCPADDTFQEPWMIQSALRKGAMLRHYDRSMITNPRFQKYALTLAKQKQIPCQESVRSGGGTNGAMLHVASNGTPTIVIGIPVRYIHSQHGICTYEDFEHSVDLAVEIITSLTKETIEQF